MLRKEAVVQEVIDIQKILKILKSKLAKMIFAGCI